LPRLLSTAQRCAGIACCAVLAVSAYAQTQVRPGPELYELRPALAQKKDAEQVSGAQSNTAVPPGSGAGGTGFVSTNTPAKSVKTGALKAKKAASAPPPTPGLAARVSDAIAEDTGSSIEVTGSILRRTDRRTMDETDPYEQVGVRVGSFDVKPSIEIYGGYDDNPLRLTTPRGSGFTLFDARVTTQSNWSRHEMQSELRGAFTDYWQLENNDRPEAEGRLRGRIDVTSQSRIELEGRAALTTEAAGTPDSITSAKRPPNVYLFEGQAGYVQRFNRAEIGLRGEVGRNKYQSAELISGGTLDLSDRNYTSYGMALRGSYEMTPGVKPFLEAEMDRRVFDHKVDFTGVERGSRGWAARAGVEFGREGLLTGSASVGYAQRQYDDPTLDDISGLLVDASLVWHATALTKVTLRAESEIGETTLAGASGVFTHAASVTIDHAFRRWLIGTVSVAYGMDEYQGAGRTDERWALGAALTYRFNRYAALRGEFRHEQLQSTAPGSDYTANIMMLGLRLQR
jgi:hypothetical protein